MYAPPWNKARNRGNSNCGTRTNRNQHWRWTDGPGQRQGGERGRPLHHGPGGPHAARRRPHRLTLAGPRRHEGLPPARPGRRLRARPRPPRPAQRPHRLLPGQAHPPAPGAGRCGLGALGPVLCLLPEDGWRLTATLVGAAALLHEAPALLVVDAAYPFEEMATLARLAGCRGLARGCEDVTEVRLAEAGFEVYRRPFSPAAVAGLVAGVIGESL